MDLRHWREWLGESRTGVLHAALGERESGRRQSGDHRAAGNLHGCGWRDNELHLGAAENAGALLADLWTLRGPDQVAGRARNLAGVLDARRQHRDRWLAEVRRDRHHGKWRHGAGD